MTKERELLKEAARIIHMHLNKQAGWADRTVHKHHLDKINDYLSQPEAAAMTMEQAKHTIAHNYDFQDWWHLAEHCERDGNWMLFSDYWEKAAHLFMESNRGFSLENIRETLRVGVNIGMQNVEQPRHLNDFNFNQEKCMKECMEYLEGISASSEAIHGRE